MKSLFERPIVQRGIDRINRWVKRHSADPVSPYMPSVLERDSLKDIEFAAPILAYEILQHKDKASLIQGDLFFGDDITKDGKWKKIYIKWYAPPSKKAKFLFPKTTRLLAGCPDVHLAMVSVLAPGAVIHRHQGPWAGSIRVHLGLETPNSPECFINVDGRSYWWKDREMVAFDDTYPHYVINSSKHSRTVLFLDVERKMDTWYNQLIVRFLNKTVARLTTRD